MDLGRIFFTLVILYISLCVDILSDSGKCCGSNKCCNSCRNGAGLNSSSSRDNGHFPDTSLQNSINNIVSKCGSRDTSLCGKSIFDECRQYSWAKERGKVIIGGLISGDKQKLDQLSLLEKKAIGCMLGMAIGDAVGAPYEFNSVDEDLYDADNYANIGKRGIKKHNSSHKDGQWTDDCSMGLCLADSLIVNNGVLEPLDLMRRFLAWWYCGYNNASMYSEIPRISWGLGGQIGSSFNEFIKDPTLKQAKGNPKGSTNGNGSIMRNAAIPICYHNDLERALLESENQSHTTHAGVQAAECCRLLTYIIHQIFINKDGEKTLKQILDSIISFKTEVVSIKGLINSQKNVESVESPGKFENWNWKDKVFAYNTERAKNNPGYIGGFAVDNMAMSLHILYHTNSFRQAIEVAVKLGGDADTVAAVVGQIAGAYYPLETIPSEWVRDIFSWDKGDIAAKALLLANINK